MSDELRKFCKLYELRCVALSYPQMDSPQTEAEVRNNLKLSTRLNEKKVDAGSIMAHCNVESSYLS